MKDALEEIVHLGSLPENKKGYEQFERFMEAGLETFPDNQIKQYLMDRIFRALATDTFEGSDEIKAAILERIHNNPELSQQYEKILSEIKEHREEPPLKFELLKDEDTQALSKDTRELHFKNIETGNYVIIPICFHILKNKFPSL